MSAKETQASKGVVLAGLLVSSDRYRFVWRSSCANAELKELAHSLKILWLASSKLHGWNLSRTCVVCSFEAFRKLRRPAMDSLFPQVLVMIPRFGLWQDKSWQRKSLATYLGLLKPWIFKRCESANLEKTEAQIVPPQLRVQDLELEKDVKVSCAIRLSLKLGHDMASRPSEAAPTECIFDVVQNKKIGPESTFKICSFWLPLLCKPMERPGPELPQRSCAVPARGLNSSAQLSKAADSCRFD
eukprot:s1948_g12.t1